MREVTQNESLFVYLFIYTSWCKKKKKNANHMPIFLEKYFISDNNWLEPIRQQGFYLFIYLKCVYVLLLLALNVFIWLNSKSTYSRIEVAQWPQTDRLIELFIRCFRSDEETDQRRCSWWDLGWWPGDWGSAGQQTLRFSTSSHLHLHPSDPAPYRDL